MRPFGNLTIKLIIGAILLFGLNSGLILFFTYQSSKQALFDTVQGELKNLASVGAAQISGDAVSSLKPGDESTVNFIALRNQLYNARKNTPDIRYSYIMAPSGKNIQFLVDDTYGFEADAATIGQVYTDGESPDQQAQDQKEILSGLNGPSVASTFYTDKWGTFLSGYAPVIDGQGHAVAIYGIDMDIHDYLSKEGFIGRQIYLVLAAILLLSIILVSYFAISFSKDVKKVNTMLKDMIEGRQRVTSAPTHRRDELGELAKTAENVEHEIWTLLGEKKNGPHY